MEAKIKSYKDLIVWQKSVELVTHIYKLTYSFPTEEKYGLVSQLQRAAISIPTNIAEGWGRESAKNYLQFLRISRGSLMEIETLLIISQNLGFITEEYYKTAQQKTNEVGKILNGLIKSLKI